MSSSIVDDEMPPSPVIAVDFAVSLSAFPR
jgi:hypothetical protein